MIPNPGEKKLILSLLCPARAHKSDQNILISSRMHSMIFAKATLQFIVEQKHPKNVQAYTVLKPSTGILAKP